MTSFCAQTHCIYLKKIDKYTKNLRLIDPHEGPRRFRSGILISFICKNSDFLKKKIVLNNTVLKTVAGEVWSLTPVDDKYSCSKALSGTLKSWRRRESRGNSAGTKQLLTQQRLIARALIKRQQEIHNAVYCIDDRCCIREKSRYCCNTIIAIHLHFSFCPTKGQWLCLQKREGKKKRVCNCA